MNHSGRFLPSETLADAIPVRETTPDLRRVYDADKLYERQQQILDKWPAHLFDDLSIDQRRQFRLRGEAQISAKEKRDREELENMKQKLREFNSIAPADEEFTSLEREIAKNAAVTAPTGRARPTAPQRKRRTLAPARRTAAQEAAPPPAQLSQRDMEMMFAKMLQQGRMDIVRGHPGCGA